MSLEIRRMAEKDLLPLAELLSDACVLLGWAQAAGKDVVIECVPEQVATRRIAERSGFSLAGERDGLIVFRRSCT